MRTMSALLFVALLAGTSNLAAANGWGQYEGGYGYLWNGDGYDQNQVQVGGNIAKDVGTANQQNNQQALEQHGDNNWGSNENSQIIDTGRKLLGWWQNQNQFGGNVAKNTGTANQQNSQQAVEQYGSNYGGNDNSQSINTGPPAKGRKLLGWYDQSQHQFGGNVAKNTGTANQQNSQQAVEQYGSNSGGNDNSQSIITDPPAKGRRLQGDGHWVYYPQNQAQFGGNVAKNVGTANQQNSQQAVEQYGSNSGGNDNSQSINTGPPAKDPPPPKRRLLGWYDQTQHQFGGNVAKNTGTANQQNSQQALEQYGSNSGGNSNSQSIDTAPQPPAKDPPPPGKGRKLLGDGHWVYYPQSQHQFGGNVAKNVGTANQQNSQQALEQYGDGNVGGNSNEQSINTGRRLQGWYDQTQHQFGGNVAKNVGTANQQNSQQAVEQYGSNDGGNDSSQSIITGPPAKDPPPGKGRKLQGWYPQSQAQFGGNVAKNVGTANQQNSQQALEQYGSNNGGNSNSQSIITGPPAKDPPAKNP